MFFLLLFLAFGIDARTTQDLLPPDGFLGKWQKSGVARVFHGADLYGHINGGSEIFLEFGFEELVVQVYRSGMDELSLELYRMTDPVAAKGIYLAKSGRESSRQLPFPNTFGPYQLLFTRDRYFIVLNNLEGRQEKQPEMIELARHLALQLQEEEHQAPVTSLPSEGLLPGTMRLIRGPYALQSVFTLGSGNVLKLSPGQTAASGDYDLNGRTWTLIACDYPTPALARHAFEHLSAHLDEYLKPIAKGDGRLVFEDYASEYGLIAVSDSRLEITVHLKQKP